MKKIFAFLSVAFTLLQGLAAQTLDDKLPVRGFVIEAPVVQWQQKQSSGTSRSWQNRFEMI